MPTFPTSGRSCASLGDGGAVASRRRLAVEDPWIARDGIARRLDARRAEGLHLNDGVHLDLADYLCALADAAGRALNEPNLRRCASRPRPGAWRQRYDWGNALADELERSWERCVGALTVAAV